VEINGPGRDVDEQIIIKNIWQSFGNVQNNEEHVALRLIFMGIRGKEPIERNLVELME